MKELTPQERERRVRVFLKILAIKAITGAKIKDKKAIQEGYARPEESQAKPNHSNEK